ncbi:MAG: large conductance mechanosensitive channel protein MscL [Lachnospiraceae bacterium]|nr:large conductance mechanosensitive channel protein MscL [Lachnospiraceae bacterium]
MSKVKKAGGFFNEFKEFALKGNVMSMAIGVLIGGAFSGLVSSFTNNIITPIINCFGKADSLGVARLGITIRGQRLQFGYFFADVINFVIMAFIVFLMVKGMTMLAKIGEKKEEAAPTTKECPFCKSQINKDATKCPHCTSEV